MLGRLALKGYLYLPGTSVQIRREHLRDVELLLLHIVAQLKSTRASVDRCFVAKVIEL